MDNLQSVLSAVETAAGAVYATVVGTYQEADRWTHTHPEVQQAVGIAQALLRVAGVDIGPELRLAELIWGRLGLLLAADPTVKGPVIAPAPAPLAARS